MPVKHTAMGRLKHEAATIYVTADGTVVAYTGDDRAVRRDVDGGALVLVDPITGSRVTRGLGLDDPSEPVDLVGV